MGSIKIEKGELIVDNSTITIIDDAKRQNNLLFFSSIIWTVFGTISVLRYLEEGDEFLLWTGLFIGGTHFCFAVYYMFLNSNASIIRKEDIISVKRKSGLKNEYIAIKLSNGRVRKITQLMGNTEGILAAIK
ncbi:hypothetical protein [Ekhidna sp.]